MVSLHSPIISLFIALIVIGYIIYRQLRIRKLSIRGLSIILLIIIYFIFQELPTFHPTSTQLLEIGITTLVSIVFGLLSCRQLHVYAGSTGKAMAKGSWTYFLWWLAAFIIKAFLAILFGETSVKNVSQVEILLPVFFLILTRNIYLYWKVNRLQLSLH